MAKNFDNNTFRTHLKTINSQLFTNFVLAHKDQEAFATCKKVLVHPLASFVLVSPSSDFFDYLKMEFQVFIERLKKKPINKLGVYQDTQCAIWSNVDEEWQSLVNEQTIEELTTDFYPFYSRFFKYTSATVEGYTLAHFLTTVKIQHFI